MSRGYLTKEKLREIEMHHKIHKDIVRKAKSVVDHKPPVLKPHSFLKTAALFNMAQKSLAIATENKRLLASINFITRTKGDVDCHRKKENVYIGNYGKRKEEARKIETENMIIYKKIMTQKSNYSRKQYEIEWKKIKIHRKNISLHKDQRTKDTTNDSEILNIGMEIKICVRKRCYLDINTAENIYLGRLIIELYNDCVPRTVKNFLYICRGICGLSYKNTPFHKIVNNYLCEGGDIAKRNGSGGNSIYGENFTAENFELKHKGPGILSMVTDDRSCTSSKFIITFKKLNTLDGKHVVFGKVVKGFNVLQKIEQCGSKYGYPKCEILISGCGEIPPKEV